jgi:hypothetical protein
MVAVDYGPLKDIVATGGSIMGAVGALGLAWRGRAKWEPSEQDIPSSAQKVGGLVAAVCIVLLWAEWRNADHAKSLDKLAIVLAISTILFSLLYGYLVGMQSYDVVELAKGQTRTRRIIGGFWLTPEARSAQASAGNVTVQALLAGAGYDPDQLWSRPSRQLAKLAFQLGYLGLVISGTVALAAISIRLGLAVG